MNETKSTIETIEDAFNKMLENSCKLLITEKLCDIEFNFCVNTINITLEYMKSKREHCKVKI